MSNSKIFKSLLAISISMALSACGGGGGDSSAPAPSTIPEAKTPIVTTVPVATYAGAEELAAFNLLNAERGRCGFGLLAQNAQLDQAARAHADWGLKNDLTGHYESPTVTDGWTGVTPGDRAAAAGYITSYSVGENLSYGNGTSTLGHGEAGVRGLLSAPYHQFSMLSPAFKDVGISVRSPLDVGSAVSRTHTNVNLGTQSGYQYLASSEVVTYPCDGTTGTNYQLTGENPNPVPGRDLVASPLGQPVMVMVRHGQVLSITSASMVKVSNNAPITLRTAITAANDPNNLLVNEGQYMGYVIPDGPLEPSTAYYVTVNGTNDGIPFTRQFTFTTGTGG